MRRLHDWNLSYRKAIELQNKLAPKVQFTVLKKTPKLIAGIDCALTKDKQRIIGCVVVLNYPSLEMLEIKSATRRLTMPYIPGLLSFREAPVCIAAVAKLKCVPEMFMVDGQGVAHPRRLGLASHLGLFFDKPTIGCAKSRLVGEYVEPNWEKGSISPLKDKGQTIGMVVRTRARVKPMFISVGHKCLLDDASEWALRCCTSYRVPEPTRLADIKVGKLNKGM